MLSKNTKQTSDIFNETLKSGGSSAAVEEAFERLDYELRREQIVDLTAELVKRIEFTLKMMEQETGVDNILTTMIPSPQLSRLKKQLTEEGPEGEDRNQAIIVIDQALRRRQKVYNRPKELSADLQRRLIKINLLGAGSNEPESK